ncbi:hypothetical protein GCM10023080_050060 [Streptomyces pseudoechinosporeus]
MGQAGLAGAAFGGPQGGDGAGAAVARAGAGPGSRGSRFGRSVNGVDPGTMETIMLPVAYDRTDPNRVVAAEPQATTLWKAIRSDLEIPESAKKSPATSGSSSAS